MYREKVPLLLGLFILSLAISSIFFPTVEKKTYPIAVKVTKTTGLSPTPDLQFGQLKAGQAASKRITFTNWFITPVKINTTINGEIAGWISIKRNFTLAPFSSQDLVVNLQVPPNARQGSYKAELFVSSERFIF